MSDMPLETCWAFNERWNNKFYYKVASCWLFLLNHTAIHGCMNIKFKNEIFLHLKWSVMKKEISTKLIGAIKYPYLSYVYSTMIVIWLAETCGCLYLWRLYVVVDILKLVFIIVRCILFSCPLHTRIIRRLLNPLASCTYYVAIHVSFYFSFRFNFSLHVIFLINYQFSSCVRNQGELSGLQRAVHSLYSCGSIDTRKARNAPNAITELWILVAILLAFRRIVVLC
jgi:hypothetical protein